MKEPVLLREVMNWEKTVDEDLPEWERPSGLYLGILGDGNGGYSCSPADSVTFARTGMDGIHYALLTDFGTIENGEEAPVICVSPMDFGNCARLVARNLREFFSLIFAGNELLLLNDFSSREGYLEAVRRERQSIAEENGDQRERRLRKKSLSKSAIERFGLTPFPDPYEYIRQIRAQREGRIAVRTMDRIGIMPTKPERTGMRFEPHSWSAKGEIPYHQLDELRSFIGSAEMETLLSFVRDYQAQAIRDTKSLLLLHDELEQRGLHPVAKRLLHCMDND